MASQYNISTEIKQVGMEADPNRTVRYQNLRQLLPVPSSPISIKCRCGYDVRRVTVHTVPTYDELSFLVHRLFRSSLSNNLGNLIIKYIDEDYDLVSVTDDLDINHAIALSPTLKVVVFDRETLPFDNKMCKNSSSLTSSLSRPFLGMNSLDLRLELAQLITKVDLLLNHIGKDSQKPPTSDNNQKPHKKLSSADLDEFVKPSKPHNNSGVSEVSSTLASGTNDLSTLNNETKPASIYTSSLGQNQPNDMSYPPSASRPLVPGATNYQNQHTPHHNSSNQQNGYLPNAGSYPAPNSQQSVNQQPTQMYPYPPNNQYTPNASQPYSQRPLSVNSQAYPQQMYPPRPAGNSGTGYPNPNASYPYSNPYPSAPGGSYQQ